MSLQGGREPGDESPPSGPWIDSFGLAAPEPPISGGCVETDDRSISDPLPVAEHSGGPPSEEKAPVYTSSHPGCGRCRACREYREGRLGYQEGHFEEFQTTQCRQDRVRRPESIKFGHSEQSSLAHLGETVRDQGTLQVNGTYTSGKLVEFLLEIKPSEIELTVAQMAALQRWRTWKEDLEIGLSRCVANEESKASLEYFEANARVNLEVVFRILDQYLFSGVMHDLVDLTWESKDPDNPDRIAHALKIFNRAGYLENIEIRITVPDQWTKDAIQQRLATLIHEMCHAVIMMFSCECQNCKCHHSVVNTIGFTGHGPCWRNLAMHMEIEANRRLTGLDHKWHVHGWRTGEAGWLEEEEAISEAMPNFICGYCDGKPNGRNEDDPAECRCLCYTDMDPKRRP